MSQAVKGMRTGTFEFLDRYGFFADLLLQKADHAKMTGEGAPLALIGVTEPMESCRVKMQEGAVLKSQGSKVQAQGGAPGLGEGQPQALKVIET